MEQGIVLCKVLLPQTLNPKPLNPKSTVVLCLDEALRSDPRRRPVFVEKEHDNRRLTASGNLRVYRKHSAALLLRERDTETE